MFDNETTTNKAKQNSVHILWDVAYVRIYNANSKPRFLLKLN